MPICVCEYCQNPFNSISGQKICADCSKEIDEVFTTVRKYIYSTSEQVTVAKLVEELDVPEKAVEYLLRQRRLTFGPHQGETGKCSVCGASTYGTALCHKCQAAFSDSMKNFVPKDVQRKQSTSTGYSKQVNPLMRRDDKD